MKRSAFPAFLLTVALSVSAALAQAPGGGGFNPGGGGNRNAAAAQFADTSTEEAVKMVRKAIDDYLS